MAYGFTGQEAAEAVPLRITPHSNIVGAVLEADFIVEAVYEDMAVKHEVLPQIEAHCPTHAIIASNSSSFRVGEMAAVLKRPAQFLGNSLVESTTSCSAGRGHLWGANLTGDH